MSDSGEFKASSLYDNTIRPDEVDEDPHDVLIEVKKRLIAYAALCWKNGNIDKADAVTDAIDDVFSRPFD